MKDFLNYMFIEPFEDGDIGGIVIGVIAWILGLIVLGLFAWLFIWLVDSSYLPKQNGIGVVVSKSYYPAHYQTTYIQSGKVLVPMTQYIDDSYSVEVKIKDLTDCFGVDYESFEELQKGQKIKCEYTSGRILESVYVQSISY